MVSLGRDVGEAERRRVELALLLLGRSKTDATSTTEAEGWGEAVSIVAGAANPDLETIRILHDSYVDRYHQDNDRTWSTATWLVGVAWTLFPAAFVLNEPQTVQAVVVSVSPPWPFCCSGRHCWLARRLGRALLRHRASHRDAADLIERRD